MAKKIYIKIRTFDEYLCILFFVFCFIPFLFPNPVITTNIQPYAAMIGTVLIFAKYNFVNQNREITTTLIILFGTFFTALLVMFFSGISMSSMRGVYNYYALFVVPCATFISLLVFGSFPEKLVKRMILLWFIVATIQFFFNRGFLTGIIGAVRWSRGYRGVVGLASEPSFLGIVSYYFLHLIQKFQSKQMQYTLLTVVMGVLYAQSAMGIIFIIGFFAAFLLEKTNSRKGVYIWIASFLGIIILIILLRTSLSKSRLAKLFNSFLYGGVDSVLNDASAGTRFNAITQAISTSLENMLLPNGFERRIGSAYGGLLVELGIFAIPAIFTISFGLALTFKKKASRLIYFCVVSALFLNNTQIGNPLLLMVIGVNYFEYLGLNKDRSSLRSIL